MSKFKISIVFTKSESSHEFSRKKSVTKLHCSPSYDSTTFFFFDRQLSDSLPVSEPVWSWCFKARKSYLTNGFCWWAQMVKPLPAMQRPRVRSLDWKIPKEGNGNPHSTILAWKSHMDRKSLTSYSPWGCKAGHDRATKHIFNQALNSAHSLISLGTWLQIPAIPAPMENRTPPLWRKWKCVASWVLVSGRRFIWHPVNRKSWEVTMKKVDSCSRNLLESHTHQWGLPWWLSW